MLSLRERGTGLPARAQRGCTEGTRYGVPRNISQSNIRCPPRTLRPQKAKITRGALHSFLRHPSGTRGHSARHHEEATIRDAFGGEVSAERERRRRRRPPGFGTDVISAATSANCRRTVRYCASRLDRLRRESACVPNLEPEEPSCVSRSTFRNPRASGICSRVRACHATGLHSRHCHKQPQRDRCGSNQGSSIRR